MLNLQPAILFRYLSFVLTNCVYNLKVLLGEFEASSYPTFLRNRGISLSLPPNPRSNRSFEFPFSKIWPERKREREKRREKVENNRLFRYAYIAWVRRAQCGPTGRRIQLDTCSFFQLIFRPAGLLKAFRCAFTPSPRWFIRNKPPSTNPPPSLSAQEISFSSVREMEQRSTRPTNGWLFVDYY